MGSTEEDRRRAAVARYFAVRRRPVVDAYVAIRRQPAVDRHHGVVRESPAARLARRTANGVLFVGGVVLFLKSRGPALDWLGSLVAFAGMVDGAGLARDFVAKHSPWHRKHRPWARSRTEKRLDRWLDQALDAMVAAAPAVPDTDGIPDTDEISDSVPVPGPFRVLGVLGIDRDLTPASRLGMDGTRRFAAYAVVVVRATPRYVFAHRYELDMSSGAFRVLETRRHRRPVAAETGVRVSGRLTGERIEDCRQGWLPVVRRACWELGPEDDPIRVTVDLCTEETGQYSSGMDDMRADAEQVCRRMTAERL